MNWGDIPKTAADVEEFVELFRLDAIQYGDGWDAGIEGQVRHTMQLNRKHKVPVLRPFTPDEMARRDWG